MADEDRLADAETRTVLMTMAAYLRAAAEEVEAVARADYTPLHKSDKVGAVLEELGESLERCIDGFPR
jgi:predicted RNA-binding protein associated with RNAse of E/G family